MPDPNAIKWTLIGLLILMVIVAGIGAVITYWYWFLLGGAAIAGAVYAMKHRTRMSNRV